MNIRSRGLAVLELHFVVSVHQLLPLHPFSLEKEQKSPISSASF